MEEVEHCPHCKAELKPETGRFCDGCGLSVRPISRADSAEGASGDEESEFDRCPACGTPAKPPLCPACFTRLGGSSEE